MNLEVIHSRQLILDADVDQRLDLALEEYRRLPTSRNQLRDILQHSLPHAMAEFRSFMQACSRVYRALWTTLRPYRNRPDADAIHTLLFYVEVKFRIHPDDAEAEETALPVSFRGYIQNVEGGGPGGTSLQAKARCIDTDRGSGVTVWQQTYRGTELS